MNEGWSVVIQNPWMTVIGLFNERGMTVIGLFNERWMAAIDPFMNEG
jgi:hypothetical protein